MISRLWAVTVEAAAAALIYSAVICYLFCVNKLEVVLDVVILVLPLTSWPALAPSRNRSTFVSFLISVFLPVTGSTEYVV